MSFVHVASDDQFDKSDVTFHARNAPETVVTEEKITIDPV